MKLSTFPRPKRTFNQSTSQLIAISPKSLFVSGIHSSEVSCCGFFHRSFSNNASSTFVRRRKTQIWRNLRELRSENPFGCDKKIYKFTKRLKGIFLSLRLVSRDLLEDFQISDHNSWHETFGTVFVAESRLLMFLIIVLSPIDCKVHRKCTENKSLSTLRVGSNWLRLNSDRWTGRETRHQTRNSNHMNYLYSHESHPRPELKLPKSRWIQSVFVCHKHSVRCHIIYVAHVYRIAVEEKSQEALTCVKTINKININTKIPFLMAPPVEINTA